MVFDYVGNFIPGFDSHILIMAVFSIAFTIIFVLILVNFLKSYKSTKEIIQSGEAENQVSDLLKSRIKEEGLPKEDVFKTNDFYMIGLGRSSKISKKYQKYLDIYNSEDSLVPSCISENIINISPNNVNGVSYIRTKNDEISLKIVDGEIEAFLNKKSIGKIQTKRNFLNDETTSSDFLGHLVYALDNKHLNLIRHPLRMSKYVWKRGVTLKFKDGKNSIINLRPKGKDKFLMAQLDSNLSKEQRIFAIAALLVIRVNSILANSS